MQPRTQRVKFILCALIAACGSDKATAIATPPPEPTLTATVTATPSIAFSPNQVVVLTGGTVTFDFGTVAHNVYFDGGVAGSPANITGSNANVTKTVTFNAIGTFVYNCHIHPGMQGTVIVQAPDE